MSSGASQVRSNLSVTVVEYTNFLPWREASLRRTYAAGFQSLLAQHGTPAAVISYNAPAFKAELGLSAQAMGIPWICAIADVPEGGSTRALHDSLIRQAAGRLYLSWGSFSSCQFLPKLHMDGGVTNVQPEAVGFERAGSKRVVLYAGSFNEYTGVGLLLQAFRRVRSKFAELWICGRGDTRHIRKAAAADGRIKFLGFVPETTLAELFEQASLFVNPRPPSVPGNAHNFPSKILEYLSYCRPVVSTWTEGLSPEYRDLLVVAGDASPGALAEAIDEVLNWPEDRRRSLALRIQDWLAAGKTWSKQATRFLGWLETEVPGFRF
jgi:glycosyltransferase involved in cell wall biosynthesis